MDSSKIEIDFNKDRYERFNLIPWWDQKKISDAKVLVVGAGAIGNEILKNLALYGFGSIYVIDFDKVEHSNLSRAPLFTETDEGDYKVHAVKRGIKRLNPNIYVKPIIGDIKKDLGVGIIKNMDLVFAGLDNREARLFLNILCYKANKTWIDGAIEGLSGFARVFTPPDGACYECTMNKIDFKLLNERMSCKLLSHDDMVQGKVPTTPTTSAIIAGMQVNEGIKIIHKDRNLPILNSEGFVFNGMTHDSFKVKYKRKKDCMSHDTYFNIIKTGKGVKTTKIKEFLNIAKTYLNGDIKIDLKEEFINYFECECGHKQDCYKMLKSINKNDLLCTKCKNIMDPNFINILRLEEQMIIEDKTLYDIGISLGDIIKCCDDDNSVYLELDKDVCEFFKRS